MIEVFTFITCKKKKKKEVREMHMANAPEGCGCSRCKKCT